jgi:ribonucleoside-diphosphate reductase beta chain
MATVYGDKNLNFDDEPLFFGGSLNVWRNDIAKVKDFDALDDKMQSFHWMPQKISLTKDRGDFKKLTDSQKHIFVNNLKYQILLDSIQGRAITEVFGPWISNPVIESCFNTQQAFEAIHSKSYSWIIKNVFNDPSEIMDAIVDHEEIKERSDEVVKYYNDFYNHSIKHLAGVPECTMRELKEKFLLAIVSVNALEGIRFYVSFACSFALAKNGVMTGSAKILQEICRDENLHLALTQKIVKRFSNGEEGEEWKEIYESQKDAMYEIYRTTISQEKDWAKYLFSEGQLLGLNEHVLSTYVNYISTKRMKSIGLEPIHPEHNNPCPWMDEFISNKNVQVAPQEAEITSYVNAAGMNPDIDWDTLGVEF